MSDTRREFPISDHCDGRRFFNPGRAEAPRGLLQVLQWRLLGARAPWPRDLANSAFLPPASVTPGSAAITFINHATFLIQLPGAVILTDPMFSRRASPVSWAGPARVRPPGVALADLPRPDIVLLSHNHYDHMDLPSLRQLQRRFAPRLVTLLGNERLLAGAGLKAAELDWWQEIAAGPLRITATPARHFSARSPFDRNRALWGGFMIGCNGRRILFAGDSGAGPHWREIRARLGAPDIALLPIGAYEPRWFMAAAHMNPAEAVQAHIDLGARCSIGMHFGTFQLTDEAFDAPVRDLDAARRAAGIGPATFDTMAEGETRMLAARSAVPRSLASDALQD